MTGEINSLGPQVAAAQQARGAAMTGALVQLLQEQPDLLAPGETAKGEVVSLRQVGQDIQLLIRLLQQNGRETMVATSANLPLAQGTQVLVSQPSANQLSLTLQQAIASNVATLTRLDTRELPLGTLVQGKVLTTQLQAQGAGLPPLYRSLVSLLNTAQAGATLAIDSPRPLPLGSLLSARVMGDQQLNFVPLSGRQDQMAIAQNLSAQQNRQASLQGLLSAMQRIARDDSQPADVRASLDKLLGSLPDIRQFGDARQAAQALGNSGAFLEAKLFNGAGVAPDIKAQVVRLIAQLLPNVPGGVLFTQNNAAVAQALPGMLRSALGALGQVAPRTPPGGFPLPTRLLQSTEGEDDLQHLLRLAAAAISRVQSHQLASLEQTGKTPDGNLQTTWQTEIPLRTGPEFMPMQVKVQREETPEQQADPERQRRDPLEMLWRIDLAFDLHPLGPLQVQAQISKGALSSQLWAERPETAALIERELGDLRARLVARGVNVGELHCHQGVPPQGARTHLEQRWVDENA
ncbi:flagellar hook-length control protein FliK [Pseudomonas japonica]|uniref:Hook-length control protein FliK n=1 Tax=Pseudomonas japonica TaxID=256466 RepID=A0A239DP37_9PSED|nr:flagellar hook-length control protein FliK [Pseudomonas japonica]SNS33384.1 hook-length control protein FliK [Pseudomonas japonica]